MRVSQHLDKIDCKKVYKISYPESLINKKTYYIGTKDGIKRVYIQPRYTNYKVK